MSNKLKEAINIGADLLLSALDSQIIQDNNIDSETVFEAVNEIKKLALGDVGGSFCSCQEPQYMRGDDMVLKCYKCNKVVQNDR